MRLYKHGTPQEEMVVIVDKLELFSTTPMNANPDIYPTTLVI